jgi:hypothetical protein
MVIIASGHEAAMNLAHQVGGNGPVGRHFPNPSVSLHRGVRLPL